MSDPIREVAALLLGEQAGEEFAKFKFKGTPEEQERKKRGATAALSGVGAAAGAAGLTLGGHNLRRSYKAARTAQKTGSRMKALKTAVSGEKLATGLIPLEVAGLGGEIMATHILHGDAKKKGPKTRVKKSEPGSSDIHIPTKGKLQLKAIEYGEAKAVKAAPTLKKGSLKVINQTPELAAKVKEHGKKKVSKRGSQAAKMVAGGAVWGLAGYGGGTALGKLKPKDVHKKKVSKSVTWEGEISKVDTDKRQVFGWASIVEVNGEPVVDLQGDYIDHDELEKSAYDYVIKSRKGGNMHLRDGDQPVHVSDMIESFLVTPEKKEKLGLPDEMPTGWWVGYQINDDDAWNLVKSGKRTGFSIHGRGQRTPWAD